MLGKFLKGLVKARELELKANCLPCRYKAK